MTLLNDGARYNPLTDTWTPMTNVAPGARRFHVAIWTGQEMIVTPSNSQGARYNPATDSWSSIPIAPLAIGETHTAVWTGTEMLVWSGFPDAFNSKVGGRYNLATNTWRAITRENNSLGRFKHTSVWTDSEMIVWGGLTQVPNSNVLAPVQTGARYAP